MFVTICIPTYNGAAYIAKALESAIYQTYPDFEVVVVDDQSTDNTIEILNKYESSDSRIRIFQNSHNLGLVANWNRCIELAKGEWIKFLFQDDLLTPDCLEKFISHQSKSPGKEKVLFCKRKYFYKNIQDLSDYDLRRTKRIFIWDKFPNKILINRPDIINLIINHPACNILGEPPSFFIHKSVFDQYGLFDPSFQHICDLEYWLRVGINMPILLIPETLVHFRLHTDSTSNFNCSKKYLQMRYLDKIRLFRKFINDVNYYPLREELCSWPSNMYLNSQIGIFARRALIDSRIKKDNQWDQEINAFFDEYYEVKELANTNIYLLAFRYFLSAYFIKFFSKYLTR